MTVNAGLEQTGSEDEQEVTVRLLPAPSEASVAAVLPVTVPVLLIRLRLSSSS